MSLIRKGENIAVFTRERPIEKHFHDYDEIWVVLAGKASAFMIDREGNRKEFEIGAGDCWMIEVGWEHGADPITPEFRLTAFTGRRPPGSHEWRHYYIEKEGYIPDLELKKIPTNRYGKG